MTTLSEEFNNWRKKYEDGLKDQKKLISLVLEKCDRELLIKILKKRGIIKRDWNESREVYQLSNQSNDLPSMPLEMHGRKIE